MHSAGMDGTSFVQSPFTLVTSIVAPAMLTNASTVLAMSTINRLLRTRDRMASLYDKSEKQALTDAESTHLVEQVNRVGARRCICSRRCGRFTWRSARLPRRLS